MILKKGTDLSIWSMMYIVKYKYIIVCVNQGKQNLSNTTSLGRQQTKCSDARSVSYLKPSHLLG